MCLQPKLIHVFYVLKVASRIFSTSVSREKMSQITVKDITERATVNRATFYAHFTDKYDILDYTLSVTILKDLNDALTISEIVNASVISNLFITIAQYMIEVQDSCKMNSETFCNQAHKRIHNELEDILRLCCVTVIHSKTLMFLLVAQAFNCWLMWTC